MFEGAAREVSDRESIGIPCALGQLPMWLREGSSDNLYSAASCCAAFRKAALFLGRVSSFVKRWG